MSNRPYFWHTVTVLLIGACGMGLCACQQGRPGISLPGKAFQFPTGIAVHPTSGFALVASSNFDLTYKNGSLRVIDLNQLASKLQENGYDAESDYSDSVIIDDFAVSLDNFAGRMTISSDGTLAAVTIRETNQLVLVDLNVDASGEIPVLKMSCPDTTRDPKKKYPFCYGDRNVVTLDKDALQFDPFDVVLADQPSTVHRTAYVSFLRSGTVSIVDIPDRMDTSSPITLSLGPATGDVGINDLAYSPKYIYLSSRGTTTTTITNKIFSFDTASLNLNLTDLYPVLLGTETRGLALTDDESTLAVIVLNPNMLVFLDTNNNNAYLGSVALGKNPTLVRQYTDILGNDLFFVTCTQEDTVYIIDGKTQRLLQIRDDKYICEGPFDVGFFDSGTIHWALFTCFENDRITVMDLDPTHVPTDADPTRPDTYLHWIARVGKPRG